MTINYMGASASDSAQRFWCFVPGHPKTKGSMKLRPNGTAAQSVAGSTQWAMMMAEVFRRSYRATEPLNCALEINCVFVLPVEPTRTAAGDGDKLERNVWDALQPCRTGAKPCAPGCRKHAGVIADDVLVVRWSGSRRRSWGEHDPIGVYVQIKLAVEQ